MLSSLTLGASSAVIMMTGNFAPAKFSACCTSVPERSGICRSSRRQSGRSKCQDVRNSSPEAKPRALKPAACRSRTTAVLTESSSSSTAITFRTPNRGACLNTLVAAEFLIIGIGRVHNEIFGGCGKSGLLCVVGAVGEARHLNLQRHRILCVAHERIHVHRRDLLRGGVDGDRQLIARLDIILEDQIHCAGHRVYGEVPRLFVLLHLLWIRGQILTEDAFHLSHVLLHLGFLPFDDPSHEGAATWRRRRRPDESLLNLSIGSILATVLRGQFRLAVESDLRYFSPLVLM